MKILIILLFLLNFRAYGQSSKNEQVCLSAQLIQDNKYLAIKVLNWRGGKYRIEESNDFVNWKTRWRGNSTEVFVNVIGPIKFFRLVVE